MTIQSGNVTLEIWIAIVGLLFTGMLQAVIFAFFLGRLFETSNSLKRRVDSLEAKPTNNNESRLATIDANLLSIKDNMEASERRVDERFAALEGTIRSGMQFRESTVRRATRNED